MLLKKNNGSLLIKKFNKKYLSLDAMYVLSGIEEMHMGPINTLRSLTRAITALPPSF